MNNYRKLLLRVMLWSLGGAAVAGVFTIFVNDREELWRVTTMAFIAAVSAALMMLFSKMTEGERARSAGYLGMAWTAAEAILALVLIWNEMIWTASDVDEGLGLTMVWLLCGIVPASWLLFMGRSEGWAIASRVGLVCAALSTGLLVAASWMGGMLWGSGHGERVAESAWVVTLVGGGLVTSLAGFGGLGPARHWRWLGVAATVAGGLMALVHVWHGGGGHEPLFATIATTAAVVGFSNIVLIMTLRAEHRWLAWSTVAVGIATGAAVAAAVWMRSQGAGIDLLERVAGAGGIVATCGVLATAVVSRLTRKVVSKAPVTEFTTVVVICPACARKGAVGVAVSAACAGCGLGIRVELTDPRCVECGYPLRGVVGGRCPECGIAAATAAGGS